jgi:glycosyltransferase involved in cell wall biosynthesis
VRILHTCHTYWPRTDGVAIVMQRVSEGLAARGHEVTVATTLAGAPPAEEHGGVVIRRFDVRGSETIGCSGDTEAYARFVTSFRCDVVLNYAAQICTTDLVFPLLARLACRKIIAPCGFSGLRDERYAEYFSRMPARLRAYDAAVYHSRTYQDAQFAADNGLDNSVFISNGADVADISHAVASFKAKYAIRGTTFLLSVGRVEPLKGQDLVLEAFRRSKIQDAALVLVCPEIGSFASGALRTAAGPLFKSRRRARAVLYELVERHLPERSHRLAWRLSDEKAVYILADLPRQDVLTAYADADLFVFGSRVECSPLVIIEAMASGTPFISTPVGNVPEMPGGVIVRDALGMAGAIDRLAQKGEEWRELSEAGQTAWQRDYTWDRVVDQYERLYENLLLS